MSRIVGLVVAALVGGLALTSAQQPSSGPYKVLKSARVGGEGGWDYIYADADARRLYIARGAVAAQSIPDRVMVYNLDTLEPAGEIAPALADTGPSSIRSRAMASSAASR